MADQGQLLEIGHFLWKSAYRAAESL